MLDCENGAAYRSAPAVFEELSPCGHVPGASRKGFDIDLGLGALRPEACTRRSAPGGRARRGGSGRGPDGDADRTILIDSGGRVAGGDQIMSLCAFQIQRKGSSTTMPSAPPP
ncbi:MAG: hypothetical protein LBR80_04315 [Deltaproteobacteria bacterium]|nr:hypothetical protein [Deltaproteobacteria bacterium]